MKKFLLLIAAASAVIPLSAASPDKEFPNNDPYGSMVTYHFVKNPSDVCYNGQSTIILYPEFRKYETSYSIDFVNDDLDIIKTITVDKVPATKTSIVSGPEFIFEWNYLPVRTVVAPTLAEAEISVSELYPCGYNKISTADGSTIFLQGTGPVPADLVAFIESGDKIGTYMAETGAFEKYAVYDHTSCILSAYEKGVYYCTGETTGNTIVYGQTIPQTTYHYVEGMVYYNLNTLTNTTWLFATQTVFNDDEDFEIIIPQYSTTKTVNSQRMGMDFPDATGGISTIWFDGESEDYLPVLTGVDVKQANSGSIVASFEFPAEYEISYIQNTGLVFLDSKRYLSVAVKTRTNNIGYVFYYNIDRPSGIQSPQLIRQVDIAPTVVNRGEYIHVSLGNDGKIKSIDVVGINGAVENSIAGRDESETDIPTSALPKGFHIVSVKDNNGNNHTQKVIVK